MISLNTLFIITICVVVITIITNFSIAIAFRRYKALNNIEEDKNMMLTARVLCKIFKNKKPLWMLIIEAVTLCATGCLLIISATLFNNYKTYGAIYEEEFTLPISRILDNEKGWPEELADESDLLAKNIENSNTKLDDYSIILVRFGCKDCHKAAKTLAKYKKENNSYIVYSRSKIGKRILDECGPIKEVPCILEHGELPKYFN